MDFLRKTLVTQHYLYVDRECPYGPEIANAMGSAFGEVFTFNAQHGITPLSMPMTVYLEKDPNVLRFRGGVIVSAEDAARAAGNLKTDTLPAGDVITATHVGPYDSLNQTHQAMWRHMEEHAIAGNMPIWEIYVDDPGDTAPEVLRTEIYHALR